MSPTVLVEVDADAFWRPRRLVGSEHIAGRAGGAGADEIGGDLAGKVKSLVEKLALERCASPDADRK